jgi:hypothetical protein
MLLDASGSLVTEAQYWAAQLTVGTLTRQQVAFDIINSLEHRMQEVDFFYRTILLRSSAGDSGAAYWAEQLVAGMTEAQVEQGIFDSPEFQNAQTDTTSFADVLYFDVLGRLPTSDELTATANLLNSGGTRSGEEGIVINSLESAQRQVKGFYSAFFHRPPDSFADLWVTQLVGGVSAGLVEAGILANPGAEFFSDGGATVGP